MPGDVVGAGVATEAYGTESPVSTNRLRRRNKSHVLGGRVAKPKFVIFKDAAEEHRWRLVDSNGEKVAASEGYTTKYSARRSAENVKATAPQAEIVEE
jgi:uncharacterized protein YegP (UPF0339 family)